MPGPQGPFVPLHFYVLIFFVRREEFPILALGWAVDFVNQTKMLQASNVNCTETSCRRATATICLLSCTPHAAAQLQPIHALRPACGAQRALLPVAVGAMNIHDARDNTSSDILTRQSSTVVRSVEMQIDADSKGDDAVNDIIPWANHSTMFIHSFIHLKL